MNGTTRSGLRRTSVAGLTLILAAAACGGQSPAPARQTASPAAQAGPLRVGAIPDQDPEKLQRLYGKVSGYLSGKLGVEVEYTPVTDYVAAVNLFKAGDLDLVWFGGLTGVQARLEVPGAHAIAQRDIDANFHSVFIVNASTGLQPVDDVTGLARLKGLRFTFGSESSTSGRLMPQHYLEKAGVSVEDFAGKPGFSGSHDRTLELVESGSFQAGALNEQVWASRSKESSQEPARMFFRTPAYHDYHWVIRPDVDRRFGRGMTQRITQTLLSLDPLDPASREILDLFGAGSFIAADDADYAEIEAVGRRAGLIR